MAAPTTRLYSVHGDPVDYVTLAVYPALDGVRRTMARYIASPPVFANNPPLCGRVLAYLQQQAPLLVSLTALLTTVETHLIMFLEHYHRRPVSLCQLGLVTVPGGVDRGSTGSRTAPIRLIPGDLAVGVA